MTRSKCGVLFAGALGVSMLLVAGLLFQSGVRVNANHDGRGAPADQVSIDMGPTGVNQGVIANGRPAAGDRNSSGGPGDGLADAEGYNTPDAGDVPGICGNGIDDDRSDVDGDTLAAEDPVDGIDNDNDGATDEDNGAPDNQPDDGCQVTLTARETCINMIDDGVLNGDEDSIANTPQVGQDRASIDITIGQQPGPGGGVSGSRLMTAWHYTMNRSNDVIDVDLHANAFLILA